MIWDIPIRLFHWAMVVLIIALWWTAENHYLTYHRYSGYALLMLLIFRLYWGFFGSYTAKFKQFIKSPQGVISHIVDSTLPSGQPAPKNQLSEKTKEPGHNPLGGYSVVALLLVLLIQILLGLFSIDIDGFDGGPFADYLDYDLSRSLAEWHEALFNLLLGLISLHLVAILYYRVLRKTNLVTPMILYRYDNRIPSHQHAWLHLIIAVTLSLACLALIQKFSLI